MDVGWELEELGEAELLEGVTAGLVVDCDAGGTRRRVDAELLRRCCHELKGQVDPRGIRLRNAAITGLVDLAGLDVPFPLRFEDCEFDSPLMVEGARLYDLAVTRCVRVPGLLANGVRVRRDLDLSGSHVAGEHKTTASSSRSAAVWLCESEVGGRLLCVDTTLDAGGERAMQADRMHVGGTVRFVREFTARGQVRLLGAQVDGSLDLTGAHISDPDGVALDLSDAAIGGNIFLIGEAARRLDVHGRLDLNNARISGQLLVRDATLAAPASAPVKGGYARLRASGVALSAQRLTVGADIAFESGCDIRGGIDLSMSSMSSLLIGSDCAVRSPGKTALDLTNAEVLSSVTLSPKVPVEGTLRVAGAAIHGNLCLRGTRLSGPEGRSLVDAVGARIDGEVELQDLTADGGHLSFRASTIGSTVNAGGARLRNPAGLTLSLVQANVKDSVRLTSGFESRGKVLLNRATVEGRLVCTQGIFDDSDAATRRKRQGNAIEVISASINGGMDLGWQSVGPSADFTNARTSYLADDPARWPDRFLISGFSYERLERPQGPARKGEGRPARQIWDHAARAAWLRRQEAYDAGPYEQAARVFRQHGYPRGAQEILIAQRRHARSAMSGRGARARRALDGAFSLTVAYGFRPARVLWAIAALLILVTVTLQVPAARAEMRATTSSGAVYTLTGPLQPASGSAGAHGPRADACGDGQVRCFNPVLYAIDTVIPLVSLDQRSTWYPDTGTTAGIVMQWWLNGATILGWLLSSIFVLALANLARSD